MTHEIRNLKGEVVEEIDENEPWYQFSATTWALVGGLLLFNVGCFLNPNIVDYVFRQLDFRLWPWWYCAAFLVIIAFSVKWYLLSQAWEDFEAEDIEVEKKFLTMSFTITAELLVLIFLNAIQLIRFFSTPLWYWFSLGVYSHMALLAFLLVGGMVAWTIYVIKEWYVVAFPS